MLIYFVFCPDVRCKRFVFFSSEFAILALLWSGFLVYRNCATMSAHPGNSLFILNIFAMGQNLRFDHSTKVAAF